MGAQERKQREKQQRRRLIIDCARRIAEADGWEAVTTRRLANEIEYSPPVLYSHFPDGRDGIVNAVAIEGFAEFTESLGEALDAAPGPQRLATFIDAYLRFGDDNPATYEAMFGMRLSVPFADSTSPDELRRAFAMLVSVVGESHGETKETVAELFWSALHGMWSLTRGQRLPPANHASRVRALAQLFG